MKKNIRKRRYSFISFPHLLIYAFTHVQLLQPQPQPQQKLLLPLPVTWVFLAITVARWTSFYSKLWSSTDANRILLRISGAGTVAVLAMILYLTVYLPRVKGLLESSAWTVYCPKVLPTMAATGVTSYLLFLRATWPIWGFFSPLISGTQFMGILMVLHFIPSMGIC